MKPPSSSGPADPSRRRDSRIALRFLLGSTIALRLLMGLVHSTVLTFIILISLHSSLHGIARAAVIMGLIACDLVIAWVVLGKLQRNRNPQG